MQTVFERNPVAPSLIDRALAGSALTSFWLDDLPARTAYPQLKAVSTHYDLVVVGGRSGTTCTPWPLARWSR